MAIFVKIACQGYLKVAQSDHTAVKREERSFINQAIQIFCQESLVFQSLEVK